MILRLLAALALATAATSPCRAQTKLDSREAKRYASELSARHPAEARDFAARRGSEPDAAALYGSGAVNAESQ